MEDSRLTCAGCGAQFPFTALEQEFYARSGFQAPTRCKACRERRTAPPDRSDPALAAGLREAEQAFLSSGTGAARDELVARLERAGRRAAVVGGAVLAEDPERRALLAPIQGAFQRVVDHVQRRTTRERHSLGVAPVAVFAPASGPHPLAAGELSPETWRELDRAAEKLTRRVYGSPDQVVWRTRAARSRPPREGKLIGRVTCTSRGPEPPWDPIPGAWWVEVDQGSTTFVDAPAAERDAFLAELARLQEPVRELLAALPAAARLECTHAHRISDEDDDHGFLDAGWTFHVGPRQGLFAIEARKTWG